MLPLDTTGYSKNITVVTMGPHATNLLSFRLWYNYKLPGILKTYKADIFIGNDYVSLKTKLPQIFVSGSQPVFYSSKAEKLFLEKAKAIIVNAAVRKGNLEKKYGIADDKINMVYPPVLKSFQPVDWNEKESIKKQYTEDKEYFLYNAEIPVHADLINLLKGFSYFKKWQKSNMLLVIASVEFNKKNSFFIDLETYKYKNEIKLLECPDKKELVKITAAAYAAIEISAGSDFENIIAAMQCNVPAIVKDSATAKEYFADHVLYTGSNFEDLGRQMMLIFKDEEKRNHLIRTAKENLAQFDRENTAALLWQTIIKTTA